MCSSRWIRLVRLKACSGRIGVKRDILGVVLCGGASRRMGRDKAAMEMRPGVSQLDYLLGLLEPFCEARGICVSREDEREKSVGPEVLRIRDGSQGLGPMAGVIAALEAAGGRAVLALACDMPLLDAGALLQILNRRDPQKQATAFLSADGQPEPLCCVYEASSLGALQSLAAAGKLSLRRYLEDAEIEAVEAAEGAVLANVNDPAELENIRRSLGKR